MNVIVDYNAYTYVTWVNSSDFKVKLSVIYCPGYSHEDGFETELIPGESHEIMVVGMGGSSGFCAEKVSVMFDENSGVEFTVQYDGHIIPYPVDYEAGYNLAYNKNYEIEEVKSPEGCSECYGDRWTYTFTNADYEAVVKYNLEKF
ncbi:MULTISPECIES: hypothetical protein [unclassified Parabacteroides]|nr:MULTISPECIES: hypothetical protein [unclassified Parabacteroides]